MRVAAFRRPQPVCSDRRSLGFEIMPGPPYWSEQRFDINFSISERRQLRSASAAFHARLERAAQAAVDTAASEWLELSWQNRSTTASSLQATQHLPGSSLPPMAL